MSQTNTPEDLMSPSISAAAQAYQQAMQQHQAPSSPAPSLLPPQDAELAKDVVMTDNTSDRAPSPAIAPSITNAVSPAPARSGTPLRTNGNDATSRATSQHPDPTPTIPKESPRHGAPTRQYLNGKVTGALLEGMKLLAKEQPTDPLRVLGEYLLQKSREIEGNA